MLYLLYFICYSSLSTADSPGFFSASLILYMEAGIMLFKAVLIWRLLGVFSGYGYSIADKANQLAVQSGTPYRLLPCTQSNVTQHYSSHLPRTQALVWNTRWWHPCHSAGISSTVIRSAKQSAVVHAPDWTTFFVLMRVIAILMKETEF